MNTVPIKLGLAGTASVVATEVVNADMLVSALITLAISVLSVLTVEGVNWLRKWIVAKTNEIKNKDKED